jgi:hypothetical protein
MWASVLALLLVPALGHAQQRHVHEAGLHVFPSTPCLFSIGGTSPMSLSCPQKPPTNIPGTAAPGTVRLVGTPGGDTPAGLGSQPAGAGGALLFQGGAGGNATNPNASANAVGGTGGTVTISGGTGGNGEISSSEVAGVGGNVSITGGAPGTAPIAASLGEIGLWGQFVNVRGQLVLDAGIGGTSHQGGTTIVTDNQAVDLNSTALPTFENTIFSLTSDNGTAANRTFTLSNPNRQGRIVILYWASNTNKGELADTGNVKLSAVWPDATNPGDSTLVLLAIDLTTWVELARSKNT